MDPRDLATFDNGFGNVRKRPRRNTAWFIFYTPRQQLRHPVLPYLFLLNLDGLSVDFRFSSSRVGAARSVWRLLARFFAIPAIACRM